MGAYTARSLRRDLFITAVRSFLETDIPRKRKTKQQQQQ